MKKLISKILCLIIAVGVLASAFVACDWITVNQDRDMQQVVASVQIDEGIESENIYKRQLVSGYVSYAYQYVQYYGYTQARAYQTVLDNLVNNRIIIQYARKQLATKYADIKKNGATNEFEEAFLAHSQAGKNNLAAIDYSKGEVDNLKQYLSDYEIAKAYYNVRKSVNSLIDSYDTTEEETTARETVNYTARTTPTVEQPDYDDMTEAELKNATPSAHDLAVADLTLNVGVDSITQDNMYDLYMAVYEKYAIDLTTIARRKAFSSVVQALKDQGLISSKETGAKYDVKADQNNVFSYQYFSDSLKAQLESTLVQKFENSLIAGVHATLSDDAVWEQYKIDYESQKATYTNDYSAYETALNSASDTKFVLCNPFKEQKYGYVANLLIGFTAEQSAELSDFKAKEGVTLEEIKQFRQALVFDLLARDQRDSWVNLNYGTYAENKFTFDQKYLLSDLAALNSYVGAVTVKDENGYTEKDSDGVEVTKWEFTKVKADAMSFDSFVADYLSLVGMEYKRFESDDFGVIADFDEQKLNEFKDLIFAFSTDPGSLSTEYGYLYSPLKSSFVTEFTDACELVVGEGVGAYTMVITDYGVHVIVCTKIAEDPYDVLNDEAKYKSDLSDETTLAYKYREVKRDAVTDTEISKEVSRCVSEYHNDTNKVKLYEKAYEDLVTETSAN